MTTAAGADSRGNHALAEDNDEGNGTEDDDDDMFNYDDDDFENYDDDFEEDDDQEEEEEKEEGEEEDEDESQEDEEVVLRGRIETEKKLDSGHYDLRPLTGREVAARHAADRQLSEVKKAMAEENRHRVSVQMYGMYSMTFGHGRGEPAQGK
jgi:hypothetical protein